MCIAFVDVFVIKFLWIFTNMLSSAVTSVGFKDLWLKDLRFKDKDL